MRPLSLSAAVVVIALAVVLAVAAHPAAGSSRQEPCAQTTQTAGSRARGRAPRHVRLERIAPVRWRQSVPLGSPGAGALRRGVMLPPEGRTWVSWDPILKRRPSREWRRWGTDTLIRTTLRVMREFHERHPNAPRVAIGDLSRPHGGDFGPQYGYIGHATHQNGLDIDIYYPRLDRRVRPPDAPAEVDLRLAQDLVDRFVAAGAETIYVGPSLGLSGPAEVVVPLVNHDNHLHVRLPAP